MTVATTSVRIPMADLNLDEICLCLDFDGTLVEIAPTPDAVIVPNGLVRTLDGLFDIMGESLVIVTGRGLAALTRFLPNYLGPVIASHGAEQRVAGRHFPHPLQGSQTVEDLARRVKAFADARAGLLFESKPLGAALHFRQAPDLGDEARIFVERIVAEASDFELHPAKMAWEVRPRGVGKEFATKDWLSRRYVKGRMPIFIGDDTTDEPAMALVQAMGGIGIKVGEGESCTARRLADPSAVLTLLQGWLAKAGG